MNGLIHRHTISELVSHKRPHTAKILGVCIRPHRGVVHFDAKNTHAEPYKLHCRQRAGRHDPGRLHLGPAGHDTGPGLTEGTEEQIIKGMYLVKPGQKVPQSGQRVQLLGSGTILRESFFAQELLEKDWGIAADVWSCPSFNELTRDGQDAERHNMLHPLETAKVPFVTQQLQTSQGPVIASTDYMKAYAEQIRPFMPKGRTYKVLGTDGFGRSDFRRKLREHFEIDRHYIVVAALKSLAEEGKLPVTKVAEAIAKYGIQADKINPLYA